MIAASNNMSRRGAASIALVILLILIGLGVTMFVLGGTRDHELTVSRLDSVQAFFAAEAGMNMAIREAIDDTDYDGNGVVGGIDSTPATLAALNNASVAVSPSVSGDMVTLDSLGVHAGSRHAFRLILESVASTGSTGTVHGIAVASSITLTGNSRMDAFDSSTGTYDPWANYANATSVATNSTSSGAVSLSGSSRIVGDLFVGEGGNPVTTIQTSGTASITGTRDVVDEPVEMPSITPPPGLPSSLGNSSFPNWGTGTLSTGTYRYNNFTISNNYELRISGAVTVYCDGDFTMQNSGRIFLDPGATLDVYAQQFNLNNSSNLNVPPSPDSADPSRVHLYQLGSDPFTIDNGGGCAAIIIAPDAQVLIPNAGHLFGLVRAESIFLQNGGHFTQDLSLTGGFGDDSDVAGSIVMIRDWNAVAPD